MTDTGELLRRFRERERNRKEANPIAAPILGLNIAGSRFTRGSEDFGLHYEFDFHIEKGDPFYGARGSAEIDHCTVIGRGVRVEIPLACFVDSDLEMVRKEIEEALRVRGEAELDRGEDRAYEMWKDRQLMRAEEGEGL